MPTLDVMTGVRRQLSYIEVSLGISGLMFEVFLRFQHDCPYNKLSKKYPDARISMWCNYSADILEVESSSLASFDGLQKDIASLSKDQESKILSKAIYQSKVQLIAKTCACCKYEIGNKTSPIFETYNFMEVPPEVITEGWEYYRLIGFDDKDLKGMLRALDKTGKAEVLYKRTMPEGVT